MTAGNAAEIQSWLEYDRDKQALNRVKAGLNDDELDRFVLGRSLFSKPWVAAPASTTARDGLGPLFNANSCTACHRNNGGGSAVEQTGTVDRSIVIRLNQDPVYGEQVSINASHGVAFEARVNVQVEPRIRHFDDGFTVRLSQPEFWLDKLQYGSLANETRLSPRRAPQLVGLGLIEAIPDKEILWRADPDDIDGDGISGRPNRVWSELEQDWMLGRYGWKARVASVIEQTARALSADMGLTSPWFPEELCSPTQIDCRQAYRSKSPDVPEFRVEAMGFYLQNLKVPAGPKPQAGKELFQKIGCQSCHRTGYRLESGIIVDPYSDFLLHDMGPDLADHGKTYVAEAQEWRTAPLWGIGLAKTLNPDAGFLHDGRATTLEEAILWHGGEAQQSMASYLNLSSEARSRLIDFLESL